jgi:hypothetical protein
MVDVEELCAICTESLSAFRNVVRPGPCKHSFHAICIHLWLTHRNTCPLCREPISNGKEWRTLFRAALAISDEEALERATYTYAFLSCLLRRFQTRAEWGESLEIITQAAEQFEIGSVRFPFMDLTSRAMARNEKTKWAQIFRELAGEEARITERIKKARVWIVDNLPTIFVVQSNEQP